uniref:Uncharacterized protein n=1 Tax=Anguilla anguilla TaxID=7936 RepID=A0A0E9VBV3_ANGAN
MFNSIQFICKALFTENCAFSQRHFTEWQGKRHDKKSKTEQTPGLKPPNSRYTR